MTGVAIVAATCLCATAGAVSVSVTGPEQTVYDWTTMRCDFADYPDTPPIAFRDAANRVQMISGSPVTRRMVGPDLDHLTRDCNPILSSRRDPAPGHFDDEHWMVGAYTANGVDVYALVHNEYHGWAHAGACPTGGIRRCVVAGVTTAVSHDGGNTYSEPAPPDNFVASLGPRYTSDFGRVGLYGVDGPIKLGAYFYAFAIIQQPDPQDTGVCAMRTADVTDPKSWRGWDGTSFSLRFRNPFYEATLPAATHTCEPLARDNMLEIERSVTFNTALGKYVMVGNSVLFDPSLSRYVYGFYFTTSDDLVHWSMRQLVMEAPTATIHQCGGPDALAYPAILDPASTDRNFRTTGATPYLYYIRIHYDSLCQQTLDRDLLRVPLQFSP